MRTKHRSQTLFLCALLWCLAACADEVGTSVRVRLVYQDTWPIESTELKVGDQVYSINLAHELLLLVPDERDGDVLELSIKATREAELIAEGSGVALVRRGDTVDAAIILNREPCGSFCTPGAKRCEGDNAASECVRNPEGCTEWGNLEDCPDDLRICSLGICDRNCRNECAMQGDSRCEDSTHQVTCGLLDADDCLDLSLPIACNSGEVCYSGKCRPECTYAGALTSLTLPGSTSAFGPAIAIDGEGTTHVIYSAATSRQLRYNSRRKGQAWSGTWQDLAGAIGEQPAITVDKAGAVHVVYGGSSVVYGSRNPGTGAWTWTTVSSETGVGSAQAIAVTASGQPHVVFFNSSTGRLRHGFRVGGAWMAEDVTTTAMGRGCDIAIVDDVLHVSSYSSVDGDLYYAVKRDGAWATTVVSSEIRTIDNTSRTSIGVDRSKTVHIVYSDYAVGFYDPRHALLAEGGSWSAQLPIDSATRPSGAYPDLVVDPFDNLHMIHRSTGTPPKLRYAFRRVGSGWSVDVQPAVGLTGFQPSIAVGPDADVRMVSAEGATVVETSRLCPVAGGLQ